MKRLISGMWAMIYLLPFDEDFDSAGSRLKPVFFDAIAISIV
jgi:hypothetical protein